MYILAGFLLIGFIANFLIRPVSEKWMMSEERLAELRAKAAKGQVQAASHGIGFGGFSIPVLLAWLAVGIPFIWGAWNTLNKALVLFH